jgi:hypothetical protein
MDSTTALQAHDGPPDFTDAEITFYATTASAWTAWLRCAPVGWGVVWRPTDEDTLELVASGVLRKAERLPVADLASALGADRVAFLMKLWGVCCSDEPHEAIKGLQLMGRVHGLWDDSKSKGKTPVQIIVQQPVPKASDTSGLPFALEPPKPA